MDSEHADINAVLSMAATDQETEVVPPAQEPEEMPLPSDPKVIFLGRLLVLDVGYSGRDPLYAHAGDY